MRGQTIFHGALGNNSNGKLQSIREEGKEMVLDVASASAVCENSSGKSIIGGRASVLNP